MEIVRNLLIYSAALIGLLGVLVVTHEFGHYVIAKILGFGVEAFSIGMGPLLWEKRGKKEAFQIRWLPLGGFVKLVGEGGDPSVPEGRAPREVFVLRKRWERFLVFVMGATFNLLMAFLLFSGIARYGLEEGFLKDEAPRIGWVVPGSPAQSAGIASGDVLKSIDGRDVGNWGRAQEEILTLTRKPYTVTVSRGGELHSFRLTPQVERVLGQEIGNVGLFPALPPLVGGVMKDSAAEAASISAGDEVVALDGQPILYWDQMQQAVSKGGPGPHEFSVRRAGAILKLSVSPRWSAQAQRWLVGIEPQASHWVQYPFPSCFAKGGRMVLDQSLLVYRTLKKLVTARMGMSSLSGPLGIARIAGEAAKAPTPIYDLLFLTASFSLQLGLLNLLPIPVLDGGHIFILGIEGVLRRDLPDRVKERMLQVGLGALVLLFAAVLVFDVLKLIP
jgi:regulator of sigma E protease